METYGQRIAELEKEIQRLKNGSGVSLPIGSVNFMRVVGLARARQSVHMKRAVGGLYSKLSTARSPLMAESECQIAATKLQEESWWQDLVEQHRLFLATEDATDTTYEDCAEFSAHGMADPGADAMTQSRLVAQIMQKSGADSSLLEADLCRVSVAVLTLIMDVLDAAAPCPHCPH